MDVLLFIYQNLDYFRKKFVFVFISGFFDGVVTFAIPVLLAELTKRNPPPIDAHILIASIVFLYLASLALQWVIRKWGEALGPQFADYLRLKYFKQLEQLPYKQLAKYHSGYLLSLMNNISESMKSILFNIFWQLSKGISTTILFFYFTARESIFIAIINLIIFIVFVALSGYLSQRIVPLADVLNKKRASLLESYADFMSNILTLKHLGIHFFAEEKLSIFFGLSSRIRPSSSSLIGKLYVNSVIDLTGWKINT